MATRKFLILLCSTLLLLCHAVCSVAAEDVQPESTRGPFLSARFSSPGVCLPPRAVLIPHLAFRTPHSPGPGAVAAVDGQQASGLGELVKILADRQEKVGSQYHLRGNVEVFYRDMRLAADEVDYAEDSGEVNARGRVRFQRRAQNDDIHAGRAQYNVENETGQFFQVRGTSGARLAGRNVFLTTTNPLFFQAAEVDKVGENTYVVRRGTVTSCRPDNEIWTFQARRTVVRPGETASIYHAWLRLKKIPLLYSPYFRHSLQRIPRSSGFLTPHLGTSSRKGTIVGDSFFWAINRSADVLLGGEYYSDRGWAQHGTLKLRPAAATFLTASYFGVVDRGLKLGNRRLDQGGRTLIVTGASELGRGWRAVANVNYLSSFEFRLAFTETYNEAISSEVHSAAFLSKYFGAYGFHTIFSRFQNFQSPRPGDSIEIRSLPGLHFAGFEQPLFRRAPLWFSFEAAGEAVSRSEPNLETARFVERFDVFPRVTLPLSWRHIHLTPAFGLRATHYGARLEPAATPGAAPHVSGRDLTRVTEDLSVDLRPPALARVFASPWSRLGERWKHVIEPRAAFRYVNGVRDFQQILRFDEGDILVNTREIEYSLVNRLYSKQKDGRVRELASWELTQRYFFDPTFGGALAPGRRNVFSSSVGLTGYAFLDRPRHFSPVTSLVRLKPSWNFDTELRLDYDPDRHRLVNTGLAANVRKGLMFTSLSQFFVRSDSVLASPSNQLRGTVGYGRLNRVGANIAVSFTYDVRNAFFQYSTTQASYNWDCCGIAVEWRRFAIGRTRNENQWRVALSFANIGTFGNLKKQERLF